MSFLGCVFLLLNVLLGPWILLNMLRMKIEHQVAVLSLIILFLLLETRSVWDGVQMSSPTGGVLPNQTINHIKVWACQGRWQVHNHNVKWYNVVTYSRNVWYCYQNNLICPTLVSFHLLSKKWAKVKAPNLKPKLRLEDLLNLVANKNPTTELRETVQLQQYVTTRTRHAWLPDLVVKEPPDAPFHVGSWGEGSVWKWR